MGTHFAGTLTADQMAAVVVVEGDKATGSGFVALVDSRPVIVTNQHVVAGQTSLKIANHTGVKFSGKSFAAARNRDIILIQLAELPEGIVPLKIAENPNSASNVGDSVLVPGNSKGGGVILVTPGKLVAFGPERIKISNPVYPGNSGGPIIHEKSGEVLGVLTESELIELDKFSQKSFNNKNSQIKSTIRYFGHRADQVESWDSLDWKKFQAASAEIKRTRHELQWIFDYLTNSKSDEWKNFQELHRVRNEALAILDSDKYSEAAKAEARVKFVRRLDSMSRTPITRAKAQNLSYVHQCEITSLEKLQLTLTDSTEVINRDVKLLNELIRRGGL